MSTFSLINVLAARVIAYRNRRRRRPARPQLGYRELMDLGMYRGHIDRVASAENEAV